MRGWMFVAGGAACVLTAGVAGATSGGLDANGCHNDRKGGTGYHCHRARVPAAMLMSIAPARGGGAYASCSAARADGASNIRRGEDGYGPHLDRDGDGVACESR